MEIVDITGRHTAATIEDVEAILQRRYESGFNAFWLSHDGEEGPMLQVLVRDDMATLNYLEPDDKPGFRPIGNLPKLNPKEDTVFWISEYRGDDFEVQNDAIVSLSSAVDAAKEFFVTASMPRCVEWLEY